MNKKIKEQILSDQKFCTNLMNAKVDAEAYYKTLKQLGDPEYQLPDMGRQIKMATHALNMTIQIIGENVIKLSDAYVKNYLSGVNIHRLYQVRNLISHAYEAVDMNLIAIIVEKYLPDIEYSIEMFKMDLQSGQPYNNYY